MARGRFSLRLHSSSALVAAAGLTMVLGSWLVREVIVAERPIEQVGAAGGFVLVVAALLVAVRWIEREPSPQRHPGRPGGRI